MEKGILSLNGFLKIFCYTLDTLDTKYTLDVKDNYNVK